VAVLAVEQNAAVALRYADRGYVLDQGICRLQGPARALLADPRVRAVYLGGSLYEEEEVSEP
jgi:branched-chain amino acid transport system ATP-binding protein